MSVFGGFSIRKMQEKYNMYLGKLLSMLQSDLIEFLSPYSKEIVQNSDIEHYLSKKFESYISLLSKLSAMEQHKYSQPKFSQLCTPLKSFISQIISSQSSTQKSFVVSPPLTSQKSLKKSHSLNKKLQSQYKNFHENSYSKSQQVKIKRKNRQYKSLGTSFNNTPKKNAFTLTSHFQNKPFSIFTIQEVEENVSAKEFKKINLQEISLDQKIHNQLRKQNKFKIYKSLDIPRKKSIQNKDPDEPEFPSYQKQMSQKQKQVQMNSNQNQEIKFQQIFTKEKVQQTFDSSVISEDKKTFYETDFNFKKKQVNNEFKKMNFSNKKKLKLLTNTLNSERYIRINHKRFINRSDLKKLVTQ